MPGLLLSDRRLCRGQPQRHPAAGEVPQPDRARVRGKHIVERTRKGSKRIKSGFGTCQFLGENRRCTVYEARPRDCRGYVCWNQEDTTVFEFARFFQSPVAKLRRNDPDGKHDKQETKR